MNHIVPRAEPLIREVPLSRLALAPENVRKTPPDPLLEKFRPTYWPHETFARSALQEAGNSQPRRKQIASAAIAKPACPCQSNLRRWQASQMTPRHDHPPCKDSLRTGRSLS